MRRMQRREYSLLPVAGVEEFLHERREAGPSTPRIIRPTKRTASAPLL
jgi:hypothetical protein